MKELNEYTAELHRRVEVECRTQRQHRIRTLAVCVPLLVCVILGAVFLPPLAGRDSTDRISTNGPANSGPGADQPDGELIAAGQIGESQNTNNGVPTGLPLTDGALPAPDGAGSGEGEVPEDFSFSFVWNVYGISSYDSRTGKLVKTSDATHPEDYITELFLTDEQREAAWSLISALNLETYPAEYDPYNDPDAETQWQSYPNQTLILTLRAKGRETTVTCRDICLGGGDICGYDQKARNFLDACDSLEKLLQSTPEWKALPDYEFGYD